MPDSYVSKVIYAGTTLIDLTSDTVAANKMLDGVTAHGADGAPVTGSITSKSTATYTPTTTDQTISAGQYLSGAQTIKGDANLVAANIKQGVSVFGVTGNFTNDATASASEILSSKTAYVKGSKVTGSMRNNGAVAGKITPSALTYTIPIGFHDGSGTVTVQDSNLIANNIRENVSILGVVGTMSSSEGMNATEGSFTPTKTGGVLNPPTGFNCFSKVTIAAIPYSESENDAGGLTVTIA